MSALTFSQALIKYRVAVAPTFRGRGAVTWFAGQRSLNGAGINIVLPERRVDDKASPEDALRELLAKLGSEDVLVGDDEEPMSSKRPKELPAVELSSVVDGIVEEGGKFVFRAPDGKEYRASRRRDLVRRVAQLSA
jgi:hypothetical protein